MKANKLVVLFGVVLWAVACEPPVTFNEPQPAETSDLLKFPKKLQGNYLSTKDSSVLTISDKLIQRVYDYDVKIHPSQLDSNSTLNGDTIFYSNTHQKEIIHRMGDSIVVHQHYVDTLFRMDYDNVVRKFKGYYFLNTRFDKENWEVKKVAYSRGKLSVSSIDEKNEIDNLTEITASEKDTVAPYTFKITKKQFKEFIKSDGFIDTEEFIKIK